MRSAPILVIGPQRTGSTLVGRLFADADGSAFTVNGKLILYLLAFLPDRNFADWSRHVRLDEIGWLLRRKPVLSPHAGFVDTVVREGAAIVAAMQPSGPTGRNAFIAELLCRIYRAWRPEAVFWGDKYNEYTLMLDDVADLFPDARFVFTRRPSQDAARSASAAFADRGWQPQALDDAVAKVEDWDGHIDAFRRARPDCATTIVQYGDLLDRPVAVLRALEDFTGVTGLVRQADRVGNRLRDAAMTAS